MKKNRTITTTIKKASFYNLNDHFVSSGSCKTQIRLGINSADEKAKKEMRKQWIEAPLTLEEKIFKSIQ